MFRAWKAKRTARKDAARDRRIEHEFRTHFGFTFTNSLTPKRINLQLIDALSSMDDGLASILLRKLEEQPIMRLNIELIKTLDCRSLQRYEQLCQALAKTNVIQAWLYFVHDARVCSIALQHLPDLKYLCISSISSGATIQESEIEAGEAHQTNDVPDELVTFLDNEHIQHIVNSLLGLEYLLSIDLRVHSSFHHAILPALPMIATLDRVVLDYFITSTREHPVDWAALTNFFGSSPRIDVTLKEMNLLDDSTYQALCRAAAGSRVRSIEIKNVFGDPLNVFGDSFSTRWDWVLLVQVLLLSSVERFSVLKTIDCHPLRRDPVSGKKLLTSPFKELTMCCYSLSYIRVVAKCPQLKVLRLNGLPEYTGLPGSSELPAYIGLPAYIEELDQALAECIKCCPFLEAIYISDNVDHCFSSMLLKQMETNYTIKKIVFDCIIPFADPLDAAIKSSIDCLVRMNLAGRAYIKSDPTNKYKGVAVLEQVLDNLAGIYYHIRENPNLLSLAGRELSSVE